MTASAQLARELSTVANQLRKASLWNGAMEPVDVVKDDFVYELLCYFRVAVAASTAFSVAMAGSIKQLPSGEVLALWPKKPGKKVNFSYLSLRDGTSTEQFQLCPGIRITDQDGKDRAPDINLLGANAPSNPHRGHLLCCWDAKYTVKSGPLSDVAVSDFVFTVQQLGFPKPPPPWTNVTPKPWGTPGILTNGAASTEPTAMFQRIGISETCYFPDTPTTRP